MITKFSFVKRYLSKSDSIKLATRHFFPGKKDKKKPGSPVCRSKSSTATWGRQGIVTLLLLCGPARWILCQVVTSLKEERSTINWKTHSSVKHFVQILRKWIRGLWRRNTNKAESNRFWKNLSPSIPDTTFKPQRSKLKANENIKEKKKHKIKRQIW
jgi:hypothetical protein